MDKEKTVKLMLVDDDESALNSLKNTITYSFPKFEIVAEASNVRDALALLENAKPELLILDIVLPDGYGFDILQLTTYTDFEVIITSSHPNYALQAFNYSALHFLEKPISIHKLSEAINRYDTYNTFDQLDNKIKIAKELLTEPPKNIMLPIENGYLMHNLEEIQSFDSENNYVKVCFNSGKSTVICRQLSHIEEILHQSHFCRIHNSFIVILSLIILYTIRKFLYICNLKITGYKNVKKKINCQQNVSRRN